MRIFDIVAIDRAATRGMLAVVVAHAGIVRHAMRMLAAQFRVCISESDSMDNVLMEAATGSTCTLFESDLAVLYGLLVCSAARQLGRCR